MTRDTRSAPFGVAGRYRVAWHSRSPRSRPAALAGALVAEARAWLPNLMESEGQGIFLANGGRLSLDATGHVVLETPECCDPWTAVLQVRAGEQTLLQLADRLSGAANPSGILIERVEGGWRESYFARAVPRDLAEQLVPHLVSRIVYAGGGGFDPTIPSLRFVLSANPFRFESRLSRLLEVERISRLRRASSLEGQWFRIAGNDGLGSDFGAVLSLGATALVSDLAGQGRLATPIALKQPLRGWRGVAADPGLTTKLRLVDGRALTAVEIQAHYLDQVGRRLADLPEWAERLCAMWRSTLDRLRQREGSDDLDWGSKLKRLEARIRAEPDWPSLAAWNDRWAEVIKTLGFALGDGRLDQDRADAFGRALAQWRSVRGRSAEGVDRYHLLRSELLEMDAAARQVGRVEPAAVGRLFGGEEIDRARVTPPGDTRAAVRGKWVVRLGRSDQRTRFRCEWGGLRDLVAGTAIDLADPSTHVAEWRSAEHRAGQGDLFSGLKDWFNFDF